MAGVVTVLILATRPGGFFTQGVNRALDLMFSGVDRIATEPCLGTIERVDGGWSAYDSWTPCASCTETQTRRCNNPPPKCGGTECQRTDTDFSYTTFADPLETVSRACASGSWVTGTCGACAGNCGSAAGTCTRSVTCDGGCCDPDLEPLSSIACAKARYPDVWSALGDWSPCSVICGTGTQTQTVTCSGSCCNPDPYDPDTNPDGKPPVTRSCLAGCCAASLQIGTDTTGNPIPGNFPNTLDGDTGYAIIGCPSGYTGTPASLCTGITFGPVTNPCVLAASGDCPAWTTDIGSGVQGTFPQTASGTPPQSLSCHAIDSRYEGTSSATCDNGSWINLVKDCRPASCPDEIFSDPNALVSCTFPASAHSATPVTLNCSTCTPGGSASYTGNFSRICDYGSWTIPTTGAGGCLGASCPSWTTPILSTIDSVYVNVTFAGSGHGVTVSGTETDTWHTCNVRAKCCNGIWVDPATSCASVTASTPNSYSADCLCWLNQCTNDPGLSSTIATKCVNTGTDPDDQKNLTADTDWSVVNSCTATKCQYACNSGYTKTGNTCVAGVCTGGNPDPNGRAGMCSGDANPSANTATTLKASCSSPAGSDPKCEYVCPGTDVIYNSRCCLPACPAGSCGEQNNATTCGTNRDCGNCCGNGALNGTEQCDGANLAGQTCATRGFTGNGVPLKCTAACQFDTSSCCNAVNGTWGGWGACSSCSQTRVCNGASCGGSCSGSTTQPCYSGTWSTGSWGSCSATCGGGTQTRTVTCSSSCCDPATQPATSQSCNTQACSSTAWSRISYCGLCASLGTSECGTPTPREGNACSPVGSACKICNGACCQPKKVKVPKVKVPGTFSGDRLFFAHENREERGKGGKGARHF